MFGCTIASLTRNRDNRIEGMPLWLSIVRNNQRTLESRFPYPLPMECERYSMVSEAKGIRIYTGKTRLHLQGYDPSKNQIQSAFKHSHNHDINRVHSSQKESTNSWTAAST